ncbi:DEAD/DEAH box helicase [Microbacterium lacticum]
MSAAAELEEVVFNSRKFREVLADTRLLTLRAEFDSIDWKDSLPTIDWSFALLYASALTSVESERSQSAILRIATACILTSDAQPEHRAAAAALLERSGNHMAVELAEGRGRIPLDAWLELSGALRLEVMRARIEHSVRLSHGGLMAVNPFQGRFWAAVEANDWLSVSAPTSAGKSRIIREHFLEVTRERAKFTLVYVVPTRALIEEVSRDLRREVAEGVGVFTLPWDPDLAASERTILVVTQERLHLVQEMFPHLMVDLMFVDEAQSLAGDARGVLLQRAIERVVRTSPKARIVFASPLSSNPELLIEAAPTAIRASAFVSETVTVNQNLVWVEHVDRKPKQRAISLIADGNRTMVGEIELAQRATTVPLRIALVARALSGGGGGNVIYVNGPAEAEKVAKAVYEQLPQDDVDGEIEDLRALIRTAIHNKYLLADVLGRRVAFHYGNMPLIVRSEIERLFGEGKIHYLVCTSTLLEGVNLPCRTIFMRNPQKGVGNPLSEADFWNLAGRAGRWGKEFQGNIVCIDTDDDGLWPNLPLVRKRSAIKRAVNEGLDDVSRLLAFIRSVDVVHEDSTAEGLFAYLCARALEGEPNDHLLDRIPVDAEREEVHLAINHVVSSATVPSALVARHSGISLTSMERLLQSFRASGSSPAHLELPLPEEPNARQRFQEALVRIGGTMTTVFGSSQEGEDRRKWQLANLIVNWMKGMPLSRLIDQRIASSTITPAVAIRSVMTDIESIARFHAPKYLACYSDLLGVYAAELGMDEIERPDYAMMLELGVSRSSEVALMSLGLSRTATVVLADYVGVDDWSTAEALTWLAAQNLDGLGIPVLIQREVNEVVSTAIRRTAAN